MGHTLRYVPFPPVKPKQNKEAGQPGGTARESGGMANPRTFNETRSHASSCPN